MSDPMQPGPEVPAEGAAAPPPVPPGADGGYFAAPPVPPPPVPPATPGAATGGYQQAGYPGPYYQQGGYPGPGYPGAPAGYGPARRTSGDAIAALVLSLLSWVVCPVVPAVIALVLAARATADIRAGGGTVDGEGMVTAARIISWINIAVSIVAVLFILFVVVLGLVTGTSSVEYDTIAA